MSCPRPTEPTYYESMTQRGYTKRGLWIHRDDHAMVRQLVNSLRIARDAKDKLQKLRKESS